MSVVKGTPWEVYDVGGQPIYYDVGGQPIYVKREDLSCPAPGPAFSKIRGVEARLLSIRDDISHIGVLDTFHSKAGWGVSYLCSLLGLHAHVFYPVYKADGDVAGQHSLRLNQQRCRDLGATLHPLRAGRSAILFHQAKKQLAEYPRSFMMPNGLKLPESVDATAAEVEEFTPSRLFSGTWVVSISSGTICAGVVQALACETATIVAHMGYSRSVDAARNYMLGQAGLGQCDRLLIVDEGYAYKDAAEDVYSVPFPCNEYYDLKAWNWLWDNLEHLEPPVTFWNIGA